MNVGYNGARSNHLDVKLAPRALPPCTSPSTAIRPPTDLVFNYDEAEAFYKMNQATVRVNKRLSKGIALGANYQYGHAIDDATSVNGSSGSVVQDWQNLAAQEGHSGLDIRHQVSGTYLFELPFGPDKFWVTTGVAPTSLRASRSRAASTSPPGRGSRPVSSRRRRASSAATPARLRPNLDRQSVTAGGGSLHQWFNTAAYSRSRRNTPGFCNYFGNAPRNSIRRAGHSLKQYGALQDHATGRNAQHGDSRHHQQRL